MTIIWRSADNTDPLPDLLRRIEQAVPPPSESDVQRELDRLTTWMHGPTGPTRPALTHPVTPPPADDVRFLTIADAAALLRVTKLTVYRLVHSGDLSAIQTGKAWYVPRDAALDYLHTLDVSQPQD